MRLGHGYAFSLIWIWKDINSWSFLEEAEKMTLFDLDLKIWPWRSNAAMTNGFVWNLWPRWYFLAWLPTCNQKNPSKLFRHISLGCTVDYTAIIWNRFFSKITPSNCNWLRRNFTGTYRRRWYVLLKLLSPSGKQAQNGSKNRILRTFLSPKQCIVSPTSRRPISVTFEHKTWIGVLRTEFRNFPKGSFTPTNLISRFFWIYFRRPSSSLDL